MKVTKPGFYWIMHRRRMLVAEICREAKRYRVEIPGDEESWELKDIKVISGPIDPPSDKYILVRVSRPDEDYDGVHPSILFDEFINHASEFESELVNSEE